MNQNLSEPISREDFAEFVYNMRQSLGASHYLFGKVTGIAAETIRKWEKQVVQPRDIDSKVEKIRQHVKTELRKRRAEAK